MNFYIFSVLLGIGLAMDACAVSMANAITEPKLRRRKMFLIAFLFGLFQFIMPIIGYFFGVILSFLIKNIIPYISLLLLGFIGTKMIVEAIKDNKNIIVEKVKIRKIKVVELFVQAIATSIDALSIGFVISTYQIFDAVICSLIIGFVTFLISFVGILIGKKFGAKLGSKAIIVGGLILIFIGIEIFIKSFI